jgi:hypothetical protein
MHDHTRFDVTLWLPDHVADALEKAAREKDIPIYTAIERILTNVIELQKSPPTEDNRHQGN